MKSGPGFSFNCTTTSATVVILLSIFYPAICISKDRNVAEFTWWDALQSGVISPNNMRNQEPDSCTLGEDLKNELGTYKLITERIVKMATEGDWAGRTYRDLELFVDKFGSRISGSDSLENSIDFIAKEMERIGMTNIHGENVTVPKWIRGEEIASLLAPRKKSLEIKALGYSVGTPPEGITAPVFVVNNFDQMIAKRDDVKGKIVVYSSPKGKMETHMHTMIGAAVASKLGAVAALAKTAAPFSLNTPHAGIQFYREKIPKIPIAALSPEDGELLSRLADAGEQIIIHLKIEILENTISQSRNLIGDLPGREKPDEFVVVSGHIDSWDVGQGAADDGVGVILALETVNMLKSMDLIPRRTLRSIMWTAEEMGLYGAHQYMKDHQTEIDKYSAAFEADYGCLKAVGYIFSGHPDVGCILREILDQAALNASNKVVRTNFMPTDVSGFTSAGVPSVILHGDDGRYFWYHHTEADVVTVLQNQELDNCLAIWASATYIIADLKEKLPRQTDHRY